MTPEPTGSRARDPKPHSEPTKPNEVGSKAGEKKSKGAGPKPHSEPTQPNEV